MPRTRFYIVDTDMNVTGTDSTDAARAAAADDDVVAVIDTEHNFDLTMSETVEIPYQNDYPE